MQCQRCQSEDGALCLADQKGNNGECPVFDKGPPIFVNNKLVVDIFRQAEGSSARVELDKKIHVFLRPADFNALFDIYDVHQDDRFDLMEKLLILQDIANEERPRLKTPKKIK